MAASQSVVPHAQFAGLAAVPFVVVQATKELHELNEDVQKSPVPDQQSTEPHLQTPPVPTEAEPRRTAAWLQVLEEDAQTSPVVDVQIPEVPQMHTKTSLAVAPSPWAQAGPVKAAHRQALEVE